MVSFTFSEHPNNRNTNLVFSKYADEIAEIYRELENRGLAKLIYRDLCLSIWNDEILGEFVNEKFAACLFCYIAVNNSAYDLQMYFYTHKPEPLTEEEAREEIFRNFYDNEVSCTLSPFRRVVERCGL